MNKEKREIALEKLEKENKFFKKLIEVIALMMFCGVPFMIFLKKIIGQEKTILVFLIYMLLLILIMCISIKKEEKTSYMIKEMITYKKMKDKELKKVIKIKDKNIIESILSKNILKIVIDNIDESNYLINIQFCDYTWASSTEISPKDLIFLLDENSISEMLDHLIKNIEIKNVEEEKVELKIKTQNFSYLNNELTVKNLFDTIEIKE